MVSEFYARRGVWVVTHGGVRHKPKGRKLVMNLAQSKGYRRRPRKRPRLYTTPGSRKITAPSSIDPAQVQEVNATVWNAGDHIQTFTPTCTPKRTPTATPTPTL